MDKETAKDAETGSETSEQVPLKTFADVAEDVPLQENVFESKGGWKWIDIIGTSPEGLDGFRRFLKKLCKKYNLHPQFVTDSTKSNNLPKLAKTTFNGKTSTILLTRYFDEQAGKNKRLDRVQDLTNKVIIIITDTEVVSIHRKDIQEIAQLRKDWETGAISSPTLGDSEGVLNEIQQSSQLVDKLIEIVLKTYEAPMEALTQAIDTQERNLFANKNANLLEKLYHIKRRASVFKRMTKLTHGTVEQYTKRSESENPHTKALLDLISSLMFSAEGLHDEADNLLNLYATVASHQTNELTSILTIYSSFFIPVTFVAGVYGMNFDIMPELRYENSYFILWGIFGLVFLGTYTFFFVRGYLPAFWDITSWPLVREVPYFVRQRERQRLMRRQGQYTVSLGPAVSK